MEQSGVESAGGAGPAPDKAVLLLIAGSLVLRLAFAANTGLGIDESYMVSLSRRLALSYYDHPPISWWLVWAATHIFGTEAPPVVRLPFILLFALSTWLMYRLTAFLFSARAGAWAALALNLSPVFGVTSASWVLPDGPLIASLLGGALCLAHALFDDPRAAPRWWVLAGIWAGLALLSKYSAILCIAGLFFYLLTSPRDRFWLARPWPWIAALIAVALFAPVILWNAEQGWASFAFQGGRAAASRFRPVAPLVTIAGEALYVLPWTWAILVARLGVAARRGPREAKGWFLGWLGIGPVALFIIVSFWSSQRILPHWAAPGYLMLFPLAGDCLARQAAAGKRWLPRATMATAILILALAGIVASEIRFDWIPRLYPAYRHGTEPEMEAVDWTALRAELATRGLLDSRKIAVAGTKYWMAGKLDYALGGTPEVVCYCDDARQYGIEHPLSGIAGKDVVILDTGLTLEAAKAIDAGRFDSIEPLPDIAILHDGTPSMTLHAYLGHDLHVR